MTITFIVGTGRCGSTMFSRVLQAHPDVLSMNEFFTSLAARGNEVFQQRALDGSEFWSLLADPTPPFGAFAASACRSAEMIYPYGSGRFRPEDGFPAISHMALPALTPDPDALYDHLAETVPAWPRRPAADQYRALFAHLGQRLGGSVVVERSGASLAYLPALYALFPEARFVHLSRSGPACALSMSRHIAFRSLLLRTEAMTFLQLASPFDITAAHAADLPEHLSHLAGDVDCERVMRTAIPLAAFGHLWSQITTQGVEDFLRLPPDHRMALSYEHVLDAPEHHLGQLADFLGTKPDPQWLHEAAASVIRNDRPPVTDPETLHACAPGTRALEHQTRVLATTAQT
ncbi:sulfotransferase [Streptomyces sp. NPDC048507]|uniref:sulfotransferase n=1 Tax=Streptomyces sp. NPDC048507 TaxID=3365560 RepID=UPI00371A1544